MRLGIAPIPATFGATGALGKRWVQGVVGRTRAPQIPEVLDAPNINGVPERLPRLCLDSKQIEATLGSREGTLKAWVTTFFVFSAAFRTLECFGRLNFFSTLRRARSKRIRTAVSDQPC